MLLIRKKQDTGSRNIYWRMFFNAFILISAGSALADVSFNKLVIDRVFRSEGVAAADINKDGKMDIMAGEVWYEAPGWQMHEIAPPGKYDGTKGYSNVFAHFAYDVNGDGWDDSIITTMMGEPCWWFENPQNKPGHWKKRQGFRSACNETPLFADLFGDGTRVAVWAVQPEGYIAWLEMDKDPEKRWTMHAVSGPKAPSSDKFGHGLGVGDVNGDGLNDILVTAGWWQAPEDRRKPNWKFHPAKLGEACADMLVHDVDGDGDSDVITSSAHNYGVWWFEQQADGKFVQHEISKDTSQNHAMVLVDINGDGAKDFVSGKRYFAHNGNDPGSGDPAVVYWYEIKPGGSGKAAFTRHIIDDNSGIGTQFQVADMNNDGRPDIVTSNKKGVFLFTQ